jgi:hypothetical protein
MRISLHQPFSIRPHPVRGSLDEYPESETRELADEKGGFFSFSAMSIAARARARVCRLLRIYPFSFFLFLKSERNLSEGHYSVARYERGTVSRIDGGTRMLNGASKCIIKQS